MSWMDTWSRPSANSNAPAPLYLIPGESVRYCQTCGRVMNSKKASKGATSTTPVKYCSDRCRSRKPGAKDRRIERAIASLLDGEEGSGIEKTGARMRAVKGDRRVIVTCDEIEEVVFGSRFDPEKVYGRRKNRASRAVDPRNTDWKSVDMESDDGQPSDNPADSSSSEAGVAIADDSSQASEKRSGVCQGKAREVKNPSLDSVDEKRREGAKRAEEREMVRRAARRVIVFGVETAASDTVTDHPSKVKTRGKDGDSTQTKMLPRKAEGLMNGMVVEPSFAKGNWSIRWRE